MTLSESLIKKWNPLMKVGETPVTNVEMQKSLAQLLENTRKQLIRDGLITEAAHDGRGSANQGLGGEVASDYGYAKNPETGAIEPSIMPNPAGNNAFYPTMVLPVLRRVYPELIAHELVGVQAMNQPIGFVAVYRARLSGLDGFVGDGTGRATNEIGFPPIAVGYTGMAEDETKLSALTKNPVNGSRNSAIDFDDNGQPKNYNADSFISTVTQNTNWPNGFNKENGTRDASSWVPGTPSISGDWGQGAFNTPEVQFADIVHGTYPTVTFGYETREVVAKTRKLGAHWSPELAEDMQVMNNLNVETEFINSITYEIGAQIDRQILNEMFKMAIASGNISIIEANKLVGIDGPSKVVALLARINYLANLIAMKTRRGGGNFIIASPKICSFLSMLGVTKFISNNGTMPTVPNTAVGALQKVGLINDGQQLLIRDTYAAGDYVLIGYKGKQLGDTGIIYAPYVPIQITKAMRPDSFTHELGARTRYGMVANPLDGGEFYTLVKIVGADKLIEGGTIRVERVGEGD